MTNQERLKDFDSEPVEYCSKCYSLKIVHEDAYDCDCCMDCGSTEIETATIEEWEELYRKRYGHSYIKKSNDPRTSVFFKMSIQDLKMKVFNSNIVNLVAHTLYPGFPKGLSKTDTVLLLFDKLSKDNRIDDLRLYLYDRSRNIITTK